MIQLVESVADRVSRSRLFWLCLTLSVWVSNLWWRFHSPLNGDVAWYLYATERLQQGAKLYRDVSDLNLPLVFFIHLPAVMIASFLKLPAPAVFHCMVWLFAAIAVAFLCATVRRTVPGDIAIPFFLLVCVSVSVLQANRGDFEQRDSLAGIAFLILIGSVYGRAERFGRTTTLRYLLVALASIVIAVKPYMILPGIFAVSWLIRRAGWRRTVTFPEVWIPLGVVAISGVLTLIFFPEYFLLSAETMKYYSAYNESVAGILRTVLPMLAVGFMGVVWRSESAIAPLVRLSGLTTLGFAASVVLQHKGWSYHCAPLAIWAGVTVSVIIADLVMRRSVYDALFLFPASLLIICVPALLAANTVRTNRAGWQNEDAVSSYLMEHGPGKTVLPLTTDLWVDFPLIEDAQCRLVIPDPTLWRLPGLYRDQVVSATAGASARYHAPSEMNDDEKTVFKQIVNAVSAKHPAYILVQRKKPMQGMGALHFDMLDYFSQDPLFRSELAHYRVAARNGSVDLLVRQGPQ